MSDLQPSFSVLGKKVHTPINYLDTFPKPDGLDEVSMKAIEFTSICPVTGHPDFGTVTIHYVPDEKCIESKSLKLYLWQFRDQGTFCETLSCRIAEDVMKYANPFKVTVTVNQSPRGGIEITATSRLERPASPGQNNDK